MRLAALLLMSLGATARADVGVGEWQAAGKMAGVELFWRQVADSRVHEVRALGVVDVAAERVFAFLGDIEHHVGALPHLATIRMLERSATRGRYYVTIDPPLVQKRDYCVEVQQLRLGDGRLATRFRQFGDGCAPARRGYLRMTRGEGRWLLTPLPGGRTLIDYVSFTDLAGSVPIWMINRATVKALPDILAATARASAGPRYAACPAESLASATVSAR